MKGLVISLGSYTNIVVIFGFQPWHSAAEFRRHLIRFMHDVHHLNCSRPLENGQYNRHEAIVAPIAHFVRFKCPLSHPRNCHRYYY